MAATLTLTGPTSGPVGIASTPFTVSLDAPADGVGNIYVIGNKAGTFAITAVGAKTDFSAPGSPIWEVILAAGQTSFTFTFTPGTAGTTVVSLGSDVVGVNAPAQAYAAIAAGGGGAGGCGAQLGHLRHVSHALGRR